MRRTALAWLGLAAALAGPAAWSQSMPVQSEGLQWLQRVSAAAEKLSYNGTFIYRNGSRSETTRIVHVAGSGKQMDKLEVLDGSPREVIRLNDEVRCYLPENRLVIVEQRSTKRLFPALLPISIAGLNDNYMVRLAGNARVAGLDSQIVRLEPRDAWRYGQQFWVDVVSGLLLKADVIDERGESLEAMAFTELHIGEPVSTELLQSRYAGAAKESWQVRQAKLRETHDDGPWVFKADLPGFRRQISMRRTTAGEGKGEDHEVLHWIYSDGLVALSVFISPLRKKEEPEEGLQTLGALSVVKRVVADHQIVVMGDLPPAAVKRFAEGIGVRGK